MSGARPRYLAPKSGSKRSKVKNVFTYMSVIELISVFLFDILGHNKVDLNRDK